MESQFRQPKKVINTEVNKQSIARNFGIGDNEVCYAKAGQPLSGYKAIYDKASQRAYMLPTGLTGTVTSFSTAGVLTHSGGTVDLAALAVDRGEYFDLNQTFTSGATIQRKNETIGLGAKRYRWGGTLPLTVPAGSTIAGTGGVSSTAWIETNAEFALGKAGASLSAWNDVLHLRDFINAGFATAEAAVQAAFDAALTTTSKIVDATGVDVTFGNTLNFVLGEIKVIGGVFRGDRDYKLTGTQLEGVQFYNCRLRYWGGDVYIHNCHFDGPPRKGQVATISFQGNETEGTFEIDGCTFRGMYYGILAQGTGEKVNSFIARNLSFYDLMGDAIELNVVQKHYDNGCVIENIAIFNIDADKAGVNTPTFQSNWGIGIGIAGQGPYGYEIDDSQYCKNFVIRNVYAEGVRQVVHVEVGRDFTIENIHADPDNTVSTGSGLATGTVVCYGSKNFVIDGVYGEPKVPSGTNPNVVRLIMLQWGTNPVLDPEGNPTGQGEKSNACFNYAVRNVFTRTGTVWAGVSAGPNTDNNASFENIRCNTFRVFGVATHLNLNNIDCRWFDCVGHPESGDGAFPNNFVRSDKTMLTMVNVTATDEYGQGGQFFSRCRYSKITRSGGNVYAEPWVNFTGQLGPLMVPVGQVYYQATGPHGTDGSYFPSGKEFNTSDVVLVTKNGVTTTYIVTSSGMYAPDNDNFAIRAAAVGTKTIVQQKVPNGESSGSPWLYITQFEPGARITIPGAGPNGTDLKTRVAKPPYQTPPSDPGALITMDITDAIQTAVPAGTRIKATVPLTTRPALPTT